MISPVEVGLIYKDRIYPSHYWPLTKRLD